MRYLALDVGDRWVGVALSDPTGWLASPLITLRRTGGHEDVAQIGRLIDQYEIEALVIGLPKRMNGTLGEQAALTIAFASQLERLGRPITLWDERLSSVSAQRQVIEARGRGPRKGERLDAHAAAVILQTFLDSRSTPQPRYDAETV